jgi:hypothetical protein
LISKGLSERHHEIAVEKIREKHPLKNVKEIKK